jgi:hypothetical protein
MRVKMRHRDGARIGKQFPTEVEIVANAGSVAVEVPARRGLQASAEAQSCLEPDCRPESNLSVPPCLTRQVGRHKELAVWQAGRVGKDGRSATLTEPMPDRRTGAASARTAALLTGRPAPAHHSERSPAPLYLDRTEPAPAVWAAAMQQLALRVPRSSWFGQA